MTGRAGTWESAQPSPATTQRIVEAARHAMIDGGLLEVSLADISQRAGTNIALVSYYFGNREGLTVAIAEADAALATSNLDRLLLSNLTPTEKINAHIKGLIEAYFERPYIHRLLQKLLRQGSPEACATIGSSFIEPVAKARRAILSEGFERGEFRNVDCESDRLRNRRCLRPYFFICRIAKRHPWRW